MHWTTGDWVSGHSTAGQSEVIPDLRPAAQPPAVPLSRQCAIQMHVAAVDHDPLTCEEELNNRKERIERIEFGTENSDLLWLFCFAISAFFAVNPSSLSSQRIRTYEKPLAAGPEAFAGLV